MKSEMATFDSIVSVANLCLWQKSADKKCYHAISQLADGMTI